MYVKATKQKAEPEIPADIPQTELNGVEAEPVAAVSAEPQPEPVLAEPEPDQAAAQAEAEAARADEAKYALLRQIESMRRAEQIQRERLEYQRIAATRPLTHEEKLEAWKAQGLSDREAAFLRDRPRMLDAPQITALAASEALASGHEKDSSAYWAAVEQGFDKHMNRLRAQVEAREPTPEFFQPLAPKPKPVSSAARFVSAPVSREVPSSTPRPVDPRRVDLSAEEKQIAAASGLTLREYAEGKLRLLREKADGTRQ